MFRPTKLVKISPVGIKIEISKDKYVISICASKQKNARKIKVKNIQADGKILEYKSNFTKGSM